MSDNQRFTVAVVDDDESFREAVVWLLSSRSFNAAGYGDAASFFAKHPISAQGCAFMDLRLGDLSGLDAYRETRERGFDMPVIMISAYGDIATAVHAVQLGAFGWIEKPVRNEKLVETAVSACSAHEHICKQYGRAANYVRNFSLLTPREREILMHLGKGATAKEVGLELEISHRTVETHRNQIAEKLGLTSARDIAAVFFHTRHFYAELAAT
ncbi:hypothetical protein WV31_15965 [Magnetospirillum sp. ME-1]|uniref:response regulator transcription factor n=1 Tax=Magnetospirillum sp. ME-1 TaxID=1639348 RepID=UPI000A17AE35|nr:response regulator [Magnetospirillum sp. ME-1]ARJ67057.1 hypothetical protein WV31_15965 [Magnetospirillum sp. ME-1]